MFWFTLFTNYLEALLYKIAESNKSLYWSFSLLYTVFNFNLSADDKQVFEYFCKIVMRVYTTVNSCCFTGAVALVYVGQPLDTVKVKLQTFPHMYSNMLDCMRQTIRYEGVFRGLYAGTVPALVANCAENSVLFAAYGMCQKAVAYATNTPVSSYYYRCLVSLNFL